MRVLNAQQTRILSNTSRSSQIKVEVFNTTTSTWVDMTKIIYDGVTQNFVKSVTWTDDVNNTGASATVTLNRNFYFYNLATLCASSRTQSLVVIDINKPIRISATVLPYNMQNPTDFIQVFYGRIYQTDWSTYTFTLNCQDWLGQLMSTWLEAPLQLYGTAITIPYTPAQTTMQGILTYANSALLANGTLVLPTLYSINGTSGTPFLTGSSPDDPGWGIPPFQQAEMACFTALDNINQQIGWVLRQKWNNNISNWALTWFDPLRANTTSTWTFDQSHFLENVSQCGLHLGDIRNAVNVVYVDTTGVSQRVQQIPSGLPGPIIDATSIAKYGRQYMQIGQEGTVQITSNVQANQMAVSALSDLAEPLLDFVVDVPFFFPVELNDIYLFKADYYHFDSDQTLAVINYTHTVEDGQIGTTTLGLRGKPTAGTRRWFDRQFQQVTTPYGVTNSNTSAEGTGNLLPNGNGGQSSRF